MHDVRGHRLFLDISNVFCDLRIYRMFKIWELHVIIMKNVNIHACSVAFCFLAISNCWTTCRSAYRIVIWLTLRGLLHLSSSGSLFVRERIGIYTVSGYICTKSWNDKNTKFVTYPWVSRKYFKFRNYADCLTVSSWEFLPRQV